MKHPVLRSLLGYFLNGLLITVPLAITLFILYRLFLFIDNLITFESKIPGLGILIVVGIVVAVGFLGGSLIAVPIRRWFENLLERAPLIKTMYMAINDLVSAFVGKKKRFTKPVLITLNKDNNLEQLGFVTDEELEKLGKSPGKVAVYIPHSYAFSGNLYVISREFVKPIDSQAAEVMKYIISGGISDLDQ